jgi:hypothetical protein
MALGLHGAARTEKPPADFSEAAYNSCDNATLAPDLVRASYNFCSATYSVATDCRITGPPVPASAWERSSETAAVARCGWLSSCSRPQIHNSSYSSCPVLGRGRTGPSVLADSNNRHKGNSRHFPRSRQRKAGIPKQRFSRRYCSGLGLLPN